MNDASDYKEVLLGEFMSVLLILAMFILGVIYCFWGYRYLKVIVVLYSLLAGGYFINQWLSAALPQLGNWIWLISIAAGILLALLCFFFIRFAVFLAGGVVGLLIFNVVKDSMPEYFSGLSDGYSFLIGAAFFIILGVITLIAKKHLIIIFSAIFGSYSMIFSVGILIGLFGNTEVIAQANLQNATTVFAPYSIFASQPKWVMTTLVIGFAIAGIISQYKLTAPPKRTDTRMNRRKYI